MKVSDEEEADDNHSDGKEERRLQAVLALLGGASVACVCQQFSIGDLRRELPAYVYYRNHIRGHHALGGKPAMTRLEEQHFFALPSILVRLESFARIEQATQRTSLNCCFRVLGRNGYVPGVGSGARVYLAETIDGLEARLEDGNRFLLRDYQKWKRTLGSYSGRQALPLSFEFEPMMPRV